MQIIQSALGFQNNPLGQTSYLGYHHQNRNFIQPLVLAKPIFKPSRIFLQRQGKPFMDTLFTDGMIDGFTNGFTGDFTEGFTDGDRSDNLDINNSDIYNSDNYNVGFSDITQISRETSDYFDTNNSITTTNKFNLGNVSHLLQTEIAHNFSDEILPETPVKSKSAKTQVTKTKKNIHKKSIQKTKKSKKQPKNTTPKTTKKTTKKSKLSTQHKNQQLVNNSEIQNQTLDDNVIDNSQMELLQLTDDSQQVQQNPGLSNNDKIPEISKSEIQDIHLEDNEIIPREISEEQLPDVIDSVSNTSKLVHEADIIKNDEILTEDTENRTAEIPENNIEINSRFYETARLENTNLEEIPASSENTTSENINLEEIPVTSENSTSEIPENNLEINSRQTENSTSENTDLNQIPVTSENVTSEIPENNLEINSRFHETARLENTDLEKISTTSENRTSEIPKNNLEINSRFHETARLENTNLEEISTTSENRTSENINLEEIPVTSENSTSEIPENNIEINSRFHETARLENTNLEEISTTSENTTSEIPENNLEINSRFHETARLENTNLEEIPASSENITSEIQENIEINPRQTENSTSENTDLNQIPVTSENSTSEIPENNLEINSRFHETARLENTNLEEIPASSENITSEIQENIEINPRQTKNSTSENISSQDNENNSSELDELDELDEIDKEANELINKLPAPQGYATGGQVTATTVENHKPVAPSDTVPAMLTPGEFVINAKDAEKNLPVLKHINIGGSPEEIISSKLEETNTEPPQQIDSPDSTTKVESLQDSTLQRKEDEFATSLEETNLTSPSLGLEIGKQHLSMVNSPEINRVENTTNISTNISKKSAPNYSAPSLIFRKTNSNTSTQTNTQTPSEWSSIEDLLNGSSEQFTDFNFSNGDNNNLDYSSSVNAVNSAQTNIFAKRISTNSSINNGGNFAPPDILRDAEPVSETIDSQYSSVTPEGSEDDESKIEALAQEIYYRLRQRIEIEKERYGKSVGRLPW